MNLYISARVRTLAIVALLIATGALPVKAGVEAGIEASVQTRGDGKLIALLLELSARHPRIVEQAGELASRLAAARYSSGRYPDPNLGVAWSNYPYKKDLRLIDDRTPMTGLEFSVSQPIPFPGRLSLESQIADVEARASRLRLAIEKNRIAREFLEELLDIRTNLAELRLTRDFGERMRIALEAANVRYAVGKANLAEVSAAGVRQARFQDRSRALEGRLQSRYRTLRYFLADSSVAGSEDAPEEQTPGSGMEPVVALLAAKDGGGNAAEPTDLDRYLMRLRSRTLEGRASVATESLAVALIELSEDRRAKEESLAWMNYLPDFEVFAAYRRRADIPDDPAAGEDFMSFGFKMRVPLWSALSNHAKLEAVQEERRSARFAGRNIAENESRIFDAARIDWQTLEDRLVLYDESLIPRAERGLEAASFAYESGRGDFDALADAWDALYALRSEGLRLAADRDRSVLAMAFVLNRILPDVSAEAAGASEGGAQ
ncbi:MAG: TolC family protein [bacterium]|nr:TolC family protein [bacterium]